jgi:hypothetical protein
MMKRIGKEKERIGKIIGSAKNSNLFCGSHLQEALLADINDCSYIPIYLYISIYKSIYIRLYILIYVAINDD